MRKRNQRSAGLRRARFTGILLVALVIIPGLILGWMAIQAADHEEAVIEKQLRTALLAEVTPAADRIAELLTDLGSELEASAPDSAASAASAGSISVGLLDDWTWSSPLVGVPFLFQRPSGRFLWPPEDSSVLSPAQNDFLDLNRDFFQDRKSVDVYQNVALQFAEQTGRDDRAEPASDLDSKVVRKQKALSEFERNEDFRERLYDEAEKSGKVVPQRSTPSPRNSKNAGIEESGSTPSPYVSESLRFSQIIGEASHGWIPRLVDDRVMLLYWKRLPGDRILGCALDETALRERILGALPTALNSARVLAVLDHTGQPLFDPDPETVRDWRTPFVSREISEFLPRWELAAYLTDPAVISDRARTRALSVGLLVGVLVVSIMTGGFVVSRMLRSELRLAEQKTTFVANVSHELKTPLTSIRLFSEILRDGRQKDAGKQRQYLDIMVSETERLTRLINNVLDFSRLDREERQYSRRVMDLAPLCRELVDTQMVRLMNSGFTVEADFAVEEAWALVDPEAIKQTLLNLIANAEKYSPQEKWMRVALRVEEGSVVVSVLDRGIGVRPRDAARIFEEFYRADDSLTTNVRGTGLGLTLSQRIAEDHGGRIIYRPNAPAGSIFELYLPLRPGESVRDGDLVPGRRELAGSSPEESEA